MKTVTTQIPGSSLNKADRKQQSTHGNGIQNRHYLIHLLPGHPVIRDVDTYQDPIVTLTISNTGLSLDLSHTSPEPSQKKKKKGGIVGRKSQDR